MFLMKKPFDLMHAFVIAIFALAAIATIYQFVTTHPLNAATMLGFVPVAALIGNNVIAFFKAPPTTLAGALSAGEAVTKDASRGFSHVGLAACIAVFGAFAGGSVAALSACGASQAQIASATPIVVDLTNATCQEVAALTGSPVVEFICTELGLVTGAGAVPRAEMRYTVSTSDALALAYFRSRVAVDAGGK